jgi:uncharacterized protein YjbI with pentapeptide repeats
MLPSSLDLMTISHEQLQQVLVDHQKWLRSEGHDGKRADFSHLDISKANLAEADLRKAIFKDCNAQGTILSKAKLDEGDFERANLKRAQLDEAILVDANLKRAILCHASLKGANLKRAILDAAILKGSDLSKAKLNDATLEGADLKTAKLDAATLTRANLKKANLAQASLKKTNLKEASLVQARLNRADLTKAIFRGAKFWQCELQDAELWKADLSRINLKTAAKLEEYQLAGTDLSGSSLPDDFTFALLNHADEVAKEAGKMQILMLGACMYSILIMATTSNVEMLLNSSPTALPVINAKLPIHNFYFATPFVILALYLYFLLYVLKLWESLAALPLIMPDGRKLEQHIYPWLPLSSIRFTFTSLKEQASSFVSLLNFILTIFTVWGAVPFTMLWFWNAYIIKHDWLGTSLHIVYFGISLWATLGAYHQSNSTLKRRVQDPMFTPSFNSTIRADSVSSFLAMSVLFCISLIVFQSNIRIPNCADTHINMRFRNSLLSMDAHLEGAELSKKPRHWSDTPQSIALVKGADLRGENLVAAHAQKTFLVNADLTKSDCRFAHLEGADLRSAQLDGADLKGAFLANAQFGGADLKDVDFHDSDISNCNFRDGQIDSRSKETVAEMPATNLTVNQILSTRKREGIKLSAKLQAELNAKSQKR